ncbi:hypothetical protein [Klebsiella aerogenes]|uniref:hypothetical protein n=1 Tax=Klebsiella aerogenes TaxID=548 RepID=UPI000DA2652E|nr:hypothetical protein [Klebsiella aerogenes]HCB2860452.1 hypothetical protein [Klebsiella aerogenes]HCB2864789.1 hypothetical protein [Klebsiella aerogenes]HCB2881615.1 hypothetical protein [Klebsiella aerogenes]HCB3345852.1 hypothetical protein [Klebsiella aerogenes]HCM1812520.1 hypothetical protein [Klebsiella aerogenes]
MNDAVTFSLSYEQMTTTTEQYISKCIAKAAKLSGPEADIEMDWARAVFDHWHLLAQVGSATEAQVEADRLRMIRLIWGSLTAE